MYSKYKKAKVFMTKCRIAGFFLLCLVAQYKGALAQDACRFDQALPSLVLNREFSVSIGEKDCPWSATNFAKLYALSLTQTTTVSIEFDNDGPPTGFLLLTSAGLPLAMANSNAAYNLPAGDYVIAVRGREGKRNVRIRPEATASQSWIECSPASATTLVIGETSEATFGSGCYLRSGHIVDLRNFELTQHHRVSISVSSGTTAELLSIDFPTNTTLGAALDQPWLSNRGPDVVRSLGRASSDAALTRELLPGNYYLALHCHHPTLYSCAGRYAVRAAIGEPLPISVPTFTPSGDELEAVRHLTRFVDAWKAEGLRAIPRFYGNQDGPVPADWATEDFSNRTGPYLKALLQNWSRIEVVDAGIDNTTFPPRMVLTVRAFGASGSGAIHPVTLVKSRSGQWLIENIAQARRP